MSDQDSAETVPIKLKLKNAASSTNYSETVKEYIVDFKDVAGEGLSVKCTPVVIVNAGANPATMGNSITIQDGNSNTIARVTGSGDSVLTAGGGNALQVMAQGQLYGGGATAVNQFMRTPAIFKHQLCTTSAATAVWTPAGGKKFRIMGYVICPDAGLAAAGIQLITFLDSAAAITIAHQTYLPIAASIAHQVPIVVALPGNGYLSAVADNVLNVTMTSNVSAGAVSIFVYGTEE